MVDYRVGAVNLIMSKSDVLWTYKNGFQIQRPMHTPLIREMNKGTNVTRGWAQSYLNEVPICGWQNLDEVIEKTFQKIDIDKNR